jgi:class 3 adenylate cyclase
LVKRHSGFVAKYMGDGVLAYFGYPQAHEHDGERAVQTGPGASSASSACASPGGSPIASVGASRSSPC